VRSGKNSQVIDLIYIFIVAKTLMRLPALRKCMNDTRIGEDAHSLA
jgi:hypothetical protein